MKEIHLNHVLSTIVDDHNYEKLNKFKWYPRKGNNTWYACRAVVINHKQHIIYMHREIMNTPKNLRCDHKNHNGLDNQEHNLRNCSRSQNSMNKLSWGRSKYLGVSFSGNTIIARIHTNNKRLYLGAFLSEEEAAKAYDNAAKHYHGEFANLNFKE